MPAILAVLGAAAVLVVVEASSPCPSALEVKEQLTPLLPPARAPGEASPATAPEDREPDRAVLMREGATLRVDLFDAQGARVATRVLDASAPCSELGAAAAVMIATWETERRAGAVPPPTLPRPTPVPAVTPPAVAPPIAAPGGSRAAPGSVEIGAAFALAVSAGSASPPVAPGGRLWACTPVSRRAPRLRFDVVLAGSALERMPLGPGTVGWAHLGLGAGASFRLGPQRGAASVDLHAEALGALLVVGGFGYAIDRTDWSFDPGLSAGVRTAWILSRHLLLVGDAGVLSWLGAQSAQVLGWPSGGVALPRFEAFFAVGVAYRGGS